MALRRMPEPASVAVMETLERDEPVARNPSPQSSPSRGEEADGGRIKMQGFLRRIILFILCIHVKSAQVNTTRARGRALRAGR